MKLDKINIDGYELYTFNKSILIPYETLSKEELDNIKLRPLLLDDLDPKYNIGVGLDSTTDNTIRFISIPPTSWENKQKKNEKYISKLNKNFRVEEKILDGSEISEEYLRELGKRHFKKYDYDDFSIKECIEYIQGRKVIVIRIYDEETNVANLFCIIYNDIEAYYAFTDRIEDNKYNRFSLGNYSVYRLIKILERLNIKELNLGSGHTELKQHLYTRTEKSLGIALIDENHPVLSKLKLKDINLLKKGTPYY
jgi:hypothetical protein